MLKHLIVPTLRRIASVAVQASRGARRRAFHLEALEDRTVPAAMNGAYTESANVDADQGHTEQFSNTHGDADTVQMWKTDHDVQDYSSAGKHDGDDKAKKDDDWRGDLSASQHQQVGDGQQDISLTWGYVAQQWISFVTHTPSPAQSAVGTVSAAEASTSAAESLLEPTPGKSGQVSTSRGAGSGKADPTLAKAIVSSSGSLSSRGQSGSGVMTNGEGVSSAASVFVSHVAGAEEAQALSVNESTTANGTAPGGSQSVPGDALDAGSALLGSQPSLSPAVLAGQGEKGSAGAPAAASTPEEGLPEPSALVMPDLELPSQGEILGGLDLVGLLPTGGQPRVGIVSQGKSSVSVVATVLGGDDLPSRGDQPTDPNSAPLSDLLFLPLSLGDHASLSTSADGDVAFAQTSEFASPGVTGDEGAAFGGPQWLGWTVLVGGALGLLAVNGRAPVRRRGTLGQSES